MPEDAPHRLLFVCSGNICRSPMAEALAADLAMARGLDIETRSAGTLGLVDRPAEPRIVAVCREVGVDLSRHRSRALTAEALQWAEHTLVMETQHAVKARQLWPELPETAVVYLGPLIGKAEITDPIGRWFSGPYRASRDDLHTALTRFFRSLRRE